MEYVVKKSIKINAAIDWVWDALTNPEKTKKYFFKSEVKSSWKKGAPITFKGRMFFIIPFKLNGKILDIQPGKLLKYELHNDSDKKNGSTSTVTDELAFKDGVTTVSITDDVGQGKGAEKRYKRSLKGWDKILKGLKETVEEGG